MAGTPAADGIINPPIDELLEVVDSKYRLVIMAAKRARQINAYYSQLGEGLLEIDVAGARQVRRAAPGARLVFLAPPSWDELVRRLTGRGTEPPEVLARRLEAAREELEAAAVFDVTLVNTSVKDVCRQLVALMEQ